MNKNQFLQKLKDDLSSLSDEERINALKYYEEYFADAGEDKENDIITEFVSPEDLAQRIEEELAELTENAPRAPGADGIVLTLAPDAMEEDTNEKTEETPEIVIEAKKEEHNNNSNSKYTVKNNTMVFLIIALCTFPIWLPVLIGITMGLFGTFMGLFMGIFGIAMAVAGIAVAGIAMIGTGIVSVGYGIFSLVTGSLDGLFTIGAGLVAIGLGIIITYCFTKLAVFVCKSLFRFTRWAIRGISNKISGKFAHRSA